MSGLFHIYCGDGKGKTTAAMGLALRSAGSGKRVLILQFIKDGSSSELTPLGNLPSVDIVPQSRLFGFSWTLSPEELREAREYYTSLLTEAFHRAEGFDLLVLDEAIGAIDAGMLSEDALLRCLDHRPEQLEVVATGRGPSEALLSRADYVTEMVKRKHPFDRGIPARKGIEY